MGEKTCVRIKGSEGRMEWGMDGMRIFFMAGSCGREVSITNYNPQRGGHKSGGEIKPHALFREYILFPFHDSNIIPPLTLL